MTISSKFLKRTACMLLCSAAAVGMTAMAQSDQNGPPPAPGQTQGPPPPPPNGGGRRGGGGGPEQRMAMLQSQLSLTPDQTTKVKDILTAGRAEMKVMRDDTTMSPSDRREKMMKMMKNENEQIKAILTSDQKVKFEEVEKQQREQRRENGGGPPPPPPPSAPQS